MAGAGCFDFDGVLALCRELWAAADELDQIVKDRDELTVVAAKEWKGPHSETFLDAIEVDVEDESGLVTLLRDAANDWANAWLSAMNDESRARHDRAVDDADSAWEWLPGISDAPVTDFSPLTVVPFGPEFKPTGSLYVNEAS